MATDACEKNPIVNTDMTAATMAAYDKITTNDETPEQNVNDEMSGEKATTSATMTVASENTTEVSFEEHLNSGLSEKAEHFINEKMASIINEKVALASGSSAREKLSIIVKKVQKPALPNGRKSYWNIVESVAMDKVESFMSQKENATDYEKVLQRFDKTYRTYKYIGHKLDIARRNLLMQIPDLHRSIEEVGALRNESLDEFERQFLLSDHVYIKTTVPKTKSVYLWLGGIIMLEYNLDEAEVLLNNQLVLAIAKLKSVEHDQLFLRQQVATCIENWTNVYNWVMERDTEADDAATEEQQDGAEEEYNDDTDTEDPYTEECFPDEPYAEEGALDAENGSFPEVYAEVYADKEIDEAIIRAGAKNLESPNQDNSLGITEHATTVVITMEALAEKAQVVIGADAGAGAGAGAADEESAKAARTEVKSNAAAETKGYESEDNAETKAKESSTHREGIVLSISSSSL